MGEITELMEEPKTALRGKAAAVVVFYTHWCGDCMRSAEYEKRLSDEFKGAVEFFRLDAAEYEEIGDRYGVERYPTYIFFHKGKPLRGALIEPVAEGEARNWLEMKLASNARRSRR